MAARIVRPVFALLVLGLAVHAVNAVVGQAEHEQGEHGADDPCSHLQPR